TLSAATSLIRAVVAAAAQFSQNHFLQKSVEVHLEQTEIASRTDGGTITISELAFGEIIPRRNREPRLIQRVQPRVRVFVRNSQRAIGERAFFAAKLF